MADSSEKSALPPSFEQLRAVLVDASEGVYDGRLEALPANDPLAPIHEGINALLDALVQARRRTAAYRDEMEARLTTIELQQATIREISTPIIEVWNGVLCLPLVGIVNAERGTEVLDALLAAVTGRNARYVVVDVTGMSGMDNDTARWLLRLTGAVRLLGAQCAVTGIHGALAKTMVHANFDVKGLVTLSNLREALERFAQVFGEPSH